MQNSAPVRAAYLGDFDAVPASAPAPADTTVLRNVSFTVGKGEVVAPLGPNGAGKTTLLRTATGFVRPRPGRVGLDGNDLTGQAPQEFARRGPDEICQRYLGIGG